MLMAWLLTDPLLFLGSYALAYAMRVGWILSTDFPFGRYMAAAAMVSPVWLSVLIATRTFALQRNQRSFRVAATMLYASIVAGALFALVYYFFFGLFFSRKLLLYALLLSAVLPWIWHILMQQEERRRLRRDPPAFPALLIGATREAERLIAMLENRKSPLTVVGILDSRSSAGTALHGVRILGRMHKLEEVLAAKRITHLIQCSELEQSLNLLSACRRRGITYMLLPSVLGIVERDERVEMLERFPVTVVRSSGGRFGWFFG
jgi:FlaA1/EpsC-like NDP-sugar epimerase